MNNRNADNADVSYQENLAVSLSKSEETEIKMIKQEQLSDCDFNEKDVPCIKTEVIEELVKEEMFEEVKNEALKYELQDHDDGCFTTEIKVEELELPKEEGGLIFTLRSVAWNNMHVSICVPHFKYLQITTGKIKYL